MEEINSQESDAQILWDDVIDMLEDEGLAPATLAMLRSCSATDLEEDTLVIAAGGAFVRRNVEKNAASITDALTRAAFQPMNLRVELSREKAPAAAAAPSAPQTTITSAELERMRSSEANKTFSSPVSTPTPADRKANPLVEEITAEDSRLTFDTFVEGE